MINNSAVTTGSITLSAASLEPVVSWFFHGRPDPMPENIPLFVAAALITVGHIVYNIAKVKGWIPTQVTLPPTD